MYFPKVYFLKVYSPKAYFSKVYFFKCKLSKVYFCELHPTCVSSKLYEFISSLVSGLFASNYCCLRLLSPQLSVLSPVALPVAAAPGVPTDLRFPLLWELRDRVGGTHLQKGERPLSILSPFSPTPTSSKILLKGHFCKFICLVLKLLTKQVFHFG